MVDSEDMGAKTLHLRGTEEHDKMIQCGRDIDHSLPTIFLQEGRWFDATCNDADIPVRICWNCLRGIWSTVYPNAGDKTDVVIHRMRNEDISGERYTYCGLNLLKMDPDDHMIQRWVNHPSHTYDPESQNIEDCTFCITAESISEW